MNKDGWKWVRRSIVALVLVAMVTLLPASDVWARSGGRMGGGSFRAPSYSAPRVTRSLPSQSSYYYSGGYGGGWGMPLLFPFFVGGGGGLLPLLFLVGAGAAALRYLRARPWQEDGTDSTTTAHVTEIQIGMLASARGLQTHLDQLAHSADTSTPSGLSQLLQDVTLSLLRHQDYWAYGAAQTRGLPVAQAEQFFYQRSLQERSRFSEETLTRLGSQVVQHRAQVAANSDDMGQYVLVTLLVACQQKLDTLSVVDAASLRQTLMQWGSLPADQLLAMEVLWTPQASGDVLSDDQLLVDYPHLRRL
ncbi:MAG: DUF1517 domain-containing protein [Synechococcales cyanobacterium]